MATFTKQASIATVNDSTERKFTLSIQSDELRGVTTDDEAAIFNIPVPAGFQATYAQAKIREPFTDSGSGTGTTLDVGESSDTDRLLDAGNLEDTSNTYLTGTGSTHVFQDDGSVQVTLTPAGYNFSESTAGDILVSVWGRLGGNE